MNIKPGDKLYRVYSGFGDPEARGVEVNRKRRKAAKMFRRKYCTSTNQFWRIDPTSRKTIWNQEDFNRIIRESFNRASKGMDNANS